MHNKMVHMVTFILLIIGGLNWGLEVLNYGIGSWGLPSGLVTIIYVLVALSAIYELLTHKKNCTQCKKGEG